MIKKILIGFGVFALVTILFFNFNFTQIKGNNSLKLENLVALNVASAEGGLNYSGYVDHWTNDASRCSVYRIATPDHYCWDLMTEFVAGWAMCGYPS